jgi:hypothetical protein
MSMELSNLVPIEYNEKKPEKINMLKRPVDSEKIIEFYKIKHPDWEYEKEHRKIIFDEVEHEKGFTVKYRKEDLEGIIFGLNADKKEIKEIIGIILIYYLDKDIKVNFYRTHEIPGVFAIEVKKIESISEYLKELS